MNPALGDRNGRWKGGKTICNGYVRISAGPDRGKLEHRLKIETLKKEQRRLAVAMLLQTDPEISDWVYDWLTEKENDEQLSPLDEVHHMDFCKQNNKPGNLLLVTGQLHGAFESRGRGRDYVGRFIPRRKGERKPPQLEDVPF